MAVKRKASSLGQNIHTKSPKKQQTQAVNIRSAFRSDLFDQDTNDSFRKSYAESGPYPHAVVSNLIQDSLLRNVRSEITNNIAFTLKETDIYRIHQSGDLANLSKLDKESLKQLPSLVQLRDALYSDDFRQWVSRVTGAGQLSGTKTDMAVNVYTPGSYLLCHDDVIGSRRVSYILYLTDPDHPWKPEYGGGLRLHSTELRKNKAGEEVKVPLAEHSLNIPPSFGQLSFFTVVPGESYHDVEEVYRGKTAKEDENRIRMAISGWYHIPQEGEDGYEEGLEQALAQKSSLTQLKSAANEFDEPQIKYRHFDESRVVMNSSATAKEIDPDDQDDTDEGALTEQDLTFLLQYIRAQYLAPDMVEQIAQSFTETSMLQLEGFMCDKFSQEMKTYITNADKSDAGNEDSSDWKIARPPHKHRYAYLQKETASKTDSESPAAQMLVDLLHSHAFKKWLALVTDLKPSALARQHAIGRRFRRGKDYALASPYTGQQPQLEFTIGLTPSTGWDTEQVPGNGKHSNGHSNTHGPQVDLGAIEFGGEEVYMAGDDEEEDESNHNDSSNGNGNGEGSSNSKKTKAEHDPAVYKAGGSEEDSILFANTPAWNQFSVVLRDRGTLRFVKYVSQAAKGDRWDIKGEVELAEDAFDDEEEEEEEEDDDDGDAEEEGGSEDDDEEEEDEDDDDD